MTYQRLWAGILGASLSCGSPQQAPAGASVQDSLPTEFSLTAGEERGIAGVKVVFQAVRGDSRCPSDAQCVWAGDATAVVLVLPGAVTGPSQELLLHTNVEPRWGDALGLRVTLLSLAPVPSVAKPRRAEEYVVKLEIRRPQSDR